MKLTSWLSVASFTAIVACGPSDPPPASPTSPTTTAASAAASPSPAPVADDVSGPWLSCLTNVNCTEMQTKDREAARGRCTSVGGEASNGRCATDNVVGTCRIELRNVSIYTLKASDPERSRGRAMGARSGCEAAGGKFTEAP